MTALIVRIGLRYVAGALVIRGIMGADDAAAITGDPDLQMYMEMGIGAGIATVVEGWHVLARRFGWEH